MEKLKRTLNFFTFVTCKVVRYAGMRSLPSFLLRTTHASIHSEMVEVSLPFSSMHTQLWLLDH